MPLPTRLNAAPLIEAVFELWFSAPSPAASVLPGILLSQVEILRGGKVNRLAAADLPREMRDSDPKLRRLALVGIDSPHCAVLIGDYSLAVVAPTPYPGWTSFSKSIEAIVKAVLDSGQLVAVERCSLRYRDLFPVKSGTDRMSVLKAQISVGTRTDRSGPVNARIEYRDPLLIHIVEIATHADSQVENQPIRSGLLLSVDTVAQHLEKNTDVQAFMDKLDTQLHSMHTANKELFFDCLTQETIDQLEPEYHVSE